MNGIKKLAVAVTLLASANQVNAQCVNNNAFFGDISPNIPATLNVPGDYAGITNAWSGDLLTLSVCAGATYTVTMCDNTINYDAYLTVQTLAGVPIVWNDNFCGLLPQVQWTSTFTGTVNILVDDGAGLGLCGHTLTPGAGMWVVAYVDSYCGTGAGSGPCGTDVGTFTTLLNGVPITPGVDIAYLCGTAGDCVTSTSNHDFVLPSPASNNPLEVSEVMYALYNCAPPATPDPAVDACYTGLLWTGEDVTECGNSGIPALPQVLSNTVWYVPITADDSDNAGDPNGVVNFDQDGDGCYDVGTPLEVVYLNPITAGTPDENCYNGVVTVQLLGGLPEMNGSNYTVTNTGGNGTIVSTNHTHNNYVVMNNVAPGAYQITVTDGGGCSVVINGNYTACPCPTLDFTIGAPGSPIACDAGTTLTLLADEAAMGPGEAITPCYYVQLMPANANANNAINYYENGFLLGTLTPTANTMYQGYLSFVSPSQNNTVELCDISAGANMEYMVIDCHSGAIIASGTWIADGVGCEVITVTPPAANVDGTASFSSLPVPGAITVNTDWGAALFDPGVAGAGTHDVTYSWDNGNGCSGTVTNQIVVTDLTPPTITCPGNITVGNDPGNCDASVVTPNPATADNCIISSVTWVMTGATTGNSPGTGINYVGTATFNVGTTTVTYTITDSGGNTAVCAFTVTVNDTENPAITCPADITVGNDAGNCSAVVTYTAPTGTDNCPGASTALIAGLASGAAFPVGTTTVTYEVTDGAGNTAQCSFDVTVNDTENPAITCPADITVGNDPGSCDAVVTYTAPTGTDNCPGATTALISGPASGSTFPLGTTTITYEVTDGAGNTAQCSFDVTVNDTENPAITCPADITVGNDPGSCDAVVTYTAPTGTDNCPGASTAMIAGLASGSTFPLGTTTITFEVTDAAGNTAQCSFDVTVNDTENPAITCPADITVNNDAGNCSAVVTYTAPTGTDNCPGATTAMIAGLASGAAFPVGTTTVTYEVTDAAGNTAQCSFDVTVNDTENPSITCPADITVGNDPGSCDAVVTYTAPTGTDNCPGATTALIAGLASGATFPLGTTTVTYEVTDAAGNTAQCSFDVTVNDTENPAITCPADITVGNDPGSCDAVVTYTAPTGTDNCPGATTALISGPASGSTFPLGTTTITYEVTDAAGNTAQCSFDVTVNDTENPAITCPADITVSNDPGSCDAVVTYTAPTGTDNCPGATTAMIAGLASGATFPLGTTTVTYEVTDAAGNTAQCSFDVTVNETELPVISCPADITVSNDPGQCDAVVTYTAPVGTDNCPGATTALIAGLASGSAFPVGTTTVTYEVTDAAGNTAQCSFDVTVNDTENPAITCPADITVGNDPGNCDAVVNYTAPTGTDNCPGATTALISGPASGGTFPLGTTTVTYEVTDAAGNTAQCSFDVTVNDTENPAITCPADITVGNDPGSCDAVVTYTAPTGTDNCPGATTAMIAGLASGATFPLGTTTVTYEVTDGAGNTAQCSFDVTVNDTEAPNAICQNITINLDAAGNATIVAADIDGGSTDNCGIASIVASQTAFSCADIGVVNDSLFVTDNAGNVDTCVAQVTVVDPNVPTANAGNDTTICDGDVVVLNGSFGGSATGGTWTTSGDGGFSLNTDPNATYTPGPGDIGAGTVTLTWTTGLSPCASATDDMILTIDPLPTFTASFVQDPSACGAADGIIEICGLNPSTTYDSLYYNNGTGTISVIPFTTDAAGCYQIMNLPADGYSAFTVWLNGCSFTDPGPIGLSDPLAPTFTVGSPVDPTSCGGTDGSITISGLNPSTTYDIQFDSAGVTITLNGVTTDAAGNYVITGLGADTYDNWVVTLAGCTGSDATAIVLTDPPAPTFTVGNPVDPSACGLSDGSITISGLNPSTTYDITYDSAGVTITLLGVTTDAAGNYVINGLGADTYDNWTVTLNNCTGTDATAIVLVDPSAPTFTVGNGIDPTTCGGTDGSITISGLNPSTTYDISYDSAGVTITLLGVTTDAAGNYVINGLGADTYDNWSVTLTGCTGGDPTAITLNDPPAPTFTVGNPVDPSACGLSDGSITISGLNPSTTYDITYDSAGITITLLGVTTDAAGDFIITGLGADGYDNWTVTLNNCTGTDGTLITLVDPNAPTFTLAGTDPTMCGGTDGFITISGLLASTTYDITYDSLGVPVTMTVTTDAAGNYVINGLGQGNYINFTVTLTGCTGSDPGPIVLTDPAPPTFTLAGTDPSICGGTDGIITISGLNPGGLYGISYDSTLTVTLPNVNADAAGNFDITGLPAGTYINVTVTDSVTGCSTTDAIGLNLTDPPAANITVSSTDPTTCGGTDGTITISGLTPSTTYVVSYDSSGTVINLGTITSDVNGDYIITGLPAGSYTAFTVVDGNCSANDNTVITLSDPPTPPAPVVGTTGTYCEGDNPVDVWATAGSGGTITWYDGAGNVIGTGGTYTPDTTLGATTYYATETVAGCESAQNSVTITFQSCIVNTLEIPTGFTPNGDGDNEVWEIPGLDIFYPDNYVRIFNRWGNILYESDGYAVPWDGTSPNGGNMPTGSYFFTIDFGDPLPGSGYQVREALTGSVTIIR